ncbi:hypothetical protein NAEGRDRAFT_80567 [Naegleria gruberi]|uniref:PNPLA domain-containing protein n=1 Tax=Naegleria gruberi TaxID=5762 RepID=D2VMP7_NAEGR|nr:uncharacterized protein NAEGRDRAFT_80567 [Naegleria gruberi]EFC41770.1 hypothetical protein NAEGRDRAFT_80567 [Naegleria gruberi]|eukprot:XP_002674514.1 hypothetical protein NAEGRDRAFT_80567 [Naegleria gruberi strain NEG-M]
MERDENAILLHDVKPKDDSSSVEITPENTSSNQPLPNDEKKPRRNLGVSFSGGGIRSASFMVGVIEALVFSEGELMTNVKEFSSVSGGGYASSSFYSYLIAQLTQPEQPNNPFETAFKQMKETFERNSNYLVSGIAALRTACFFLVGALHNFLLWFCLCILLGNFLFAGVVYNVNDNATGQMTSYLSHVPLISNGTISVSEKTDKAQYFILSFLQFTSIANDIVQGKYTSFGWSVFPRELVITVFSILMVLVLVLITWVVKVRYVNHYNNGFFDCLMDGFNSFLQCFNFILKYESVKRIWGGFKIVFIYFPAAIIGVGGLLILPLLALSFLLSIFVECLKFTMFVEGLILVSWGESSFLASHHIFNSLYLVGWIVMAIIFGFIFATGKNIFKLGETVAMGLSGFFLIVCTPIMLLWIASHFCLWQIFGDYGEFTMIPTINNSEAELVCLKTFASIWVAIELFMSEYLNSAFRELYNSGLKNFLHSNICVSKAGERQDLPIFTFNCCVNNLAEKEGSCGHYSFSSTGKCRSITHNLPKLDTSNLSLSTVVSISGAAVSLMLGEALNIPLVSQFVAFVLYILGINIGEWVDLGNYKTKTIDKFFKWFLLVCVFLTNLNVFEGIYSSGLIYGSWLYRIIVIGVIMYSFGLQIIIGLVLRLVNIGRNPEYSLYQIFFNIFSLHYIPLFRALLMIVGYPDNVTSKTYFLSDGGHYENLGLLNLLYNMRSEIFAFDATEDSKLSLSELSSCLEKAIRFNIIKEDSIKCYPSKSRANNNDYKYSVDDLMRIDLWETRAHQDEGALIKLSRSNFLYIEFEYTETHVKNSNPQPKQQPKQEKQTSTNTTQQAQQPTPSSASNTNNTNCTSSIENASPTTDITSKSSPKEQTQPESTNNISESTAANDPPQQETESRKGCLWYGKATLTGEEDDRIKFYQSNNNVFPHHSTLFQLFSKEDFSAYRLLGKHVASCITNDYLANQN